jgi:hypothetical protein
MPAETRWVPTYDGPVDLNGMPSVQSWTKDAGVPDPVPAPPIDPKFVASLQAAQDAIAEHGRQLDELSRFPQGTRHDAAANALRARRIATIQDGLMVHEFRTVPHDQIDADEYGRIIDRRTGRVLITRGEADARIAKLRQRAGSRGRKPEPASQP